MPNLGDAYVNIIPKAPGISKNIEGLISEGNVGESSGRSIGTRILSGLKGALIGGAVASVLKSAFESGAALQQSFGGLDTIYGEAAEAAKAYAEAAASAGISANTYAEQAVSMGAALKAAFGGDTTAAVEAANMAIMDMADNAAKMGTDMESIQAAYQGFAKGNFTMLDNLKLGYGGTREEMQRLLADAEKISGIHYDIDNLGDIYSAIHVVQEELGLTGVAAEEAATTLSGSFNAMKASWENVMAALVTGEGMDEAMANLSTSVGNFATNVLTAFENIAPQLPDMILNLVDIIIDQAPEFIAAGAELIVKLAVGLVEAIPELAAKVPEIFAGIKDAFTSVDWASLGRSIIDGIKNGISNAASSLFESLKSLASNALQSAKNFLGIGSPSKVFAKEVGQWIPAGVALGIDDNLPPVTASVESMAGLMVKDFHRATMPGNAITPQTQLDTDRMIDALRNLKVQSNVTLQGDTRKIFRVVQNRNQIETRQTGYNSLAAAGGAA